ncbi:hypothetical protein BJX64DRAFT_293430 [Aspergillus heterothallicus]
MDRGQFPQQPMELDTAQKFRQNYTIRQAPFTAFTAGTLDQVLQDFLQDQTATFRTPEQREAFLAMMTKLPYLHVILPTAGGKTTLFLLGASLAISKTTIIVSPLIALKIDLFQKAVKLGLDPIIWTPSHGLELTAPRILLVQIEHVVHDQFLGLLEHWVAHGHVDRMIWDEYHMIPLTKNYRKVMHRVKLALKASIPMVFSSATMPQTLVQEFEQSNALTLVTPIPTIRLGLCLPQVAYHVVPIPEAGAGQDEVSLIQHALTRVQSQVTLNPEAYQELQQELGSQVSYFHADLLEAEKVAELDRFQGGKAWILLTTSAIGAGVSGTI